jgi:hypothetical protein
LLKFGKYEKILVILFLLTLPLCNPWVRGDGVGYYAFARSILIEHRLDFTKDWLEANTSFRMGRVEANGQLTPDQYTATGHIDNHFSVGPAILWSPFLIAAHVGTILYDRLGGHVPADGFSKPYRMAMAFGTAFYGFLAIFISFRLVRKYVSEGWAFWAALGIWFGSSLAVYMYFNPSWSHAHSAFAVAVFIWYWNHTRGERSWKQWLVLGLLGGLMMDVYYMNAVVLLLPFLEMLGSYWAATTRRSTGTTLETALGNLLFCAAILIAFSPTLVTKKIIYGGYLKFGYVEHWFWASPAFFKVCFSADHGLFSWTPITILAVAGFFFLRKYDRRLALYLAVTFLVFVYAMGCYENWHGISSYGSRFFVSLTVFFVLGLAALFDRLGQAWKESRAAIVAWGGTTALVLWNLGLVFQWGMHLIPDRGPISWRVAAYNQFAVVPKESGRDFLNYLTRRKAMMEQIEIQDVHGLKH